MHSIFRSLTVLYGLIGLAASVEPKAQLSFVDNEILLKLDYATYRGYYNSTNEVYTFRNIRFAAPPVGNLRWAKPAPPPKMDGIQDRREAMACTQPPSREVNTVGGEMVGGGHEDCLFLDLTIPRKVFENPQKKVPVLVWIHGGYYTQGSKDERSFHQFAKVSNGNVISVAGNYRIGSYGFLSGSTVEREGVPNAGLWDQRAALEWVQKYIPEIGGDKNQVTAMGISAGAGSIVHHLAAEGGTKNPLFQRAILQSAGYATIQDRAGEAEKKFKRAEEFAGCKGKGLACMRALSEDGMRKVAELANSGQPKGSSGWDPVPDGRYIVNTPVLEIQKGRYWKQMQSIISGSALNEAGGRWFVDPSINTTAKFEEYVHNGFANRTSPAFMKLFERLEQLYPSVETPGSPYKNTADRLAMYIADAGFNCHHRILAQAYPGRTYTYQTSVWSGTHYMDQFPSFYDPNGKGFNQLLHRLPGSLISKQAFQSYLVSEIVAGNPNTLRNSATIEWPITTGLTTEPALQGVLNFTSPVGPTGFSIIASQRLVKDRCDFWNDVWSEVDKTL